MTVSDTASPVLFDRRDSGVAVVTLNRPERMNAWGGGLAGAFYRCMDRAEADPEVRVIVVTGNGRAFCAGADMGDLDAIGGASESAGDTDVTRIILWGAYLPEDFDLDRGPERLGSAELILVRGLLDHFINEEAHVAQEARLRELGIPFKTITHAGGHEIDSALLGEIAGRGG